MDLMKLVSSVSLCKSIDFKFIAPTSPMIISSILISSIIVGLNLGKKRFGIYFINPFL